MRSIFRMAQNTPWLALMDESKLNLKILDSLTDVVYSIHVIEQYRVVLHKFHYQDFIREAHNIPIYGKQVQIIGGLCPVEKHNNKLT